MADGFLTRRRGLGTFVRERALDEKVSILHSMTETMREQHVEVETQVLRQEIVPASARVARALELTDPDVLLLERLAIVGREPVALMRADLSLRQFPGLREAPLINRSLYETLHARYGVTVIRAESVIEVERCTSKDAPKLGVLPGEPLLRVEGTAFAEHAARGALPRALSRRPGALPSRLPPGHRPDAAARRRRRRRGVRAHLAVAMSAEEARP